MKILTDGGHIDFDDMKWNISIYRLKTHEDIKTVITVFLGKSSFVKCSKQTNLTAVIGIFNVVNLCFRQDLSLGNLKYIKILNNFIIINTVPYKQWRRFSIFFYSKSNKHLSQLIYYSPYEINNFRRSKIWWCTKHFHRDLFIFQNFYDTTKFECINFVFYFRSKIQWTMPLNLPKK